MEDTGNPAKVELVLPDNPILTTMMEDFDFDNPPLDPAKIAHLLSREMIARQGLGLAAPQIGLPVRAFAMFTNPILVCFNPRIVDQSTKTIILEEGCLSYPGLYLKIERPEIIKARFTLANGEVHTEKFIGISARIFQHETDHLNGILYTSRVRAMALTVAKAKQRKLLKAQNDKTKSIIR